MALELGVRRWLRSLPALSFVAVASAAVVCVCANLLVARFYQRWDLTSSGLYSLSPATQRLLQELEAPVEAIVLLGRGDPLLVSLRQMLTTYQAASPRLSVRYVDPERQPAELAQLSDRFELTTGRTEAGRVATDAVVILVQGQRHWFITPDELIVHHAEDQESRPRLEQALSEGLSRLTLGATSRWCVTTGHFELSTEDMGPGGLAGLADALKKNNFEWATVDLRPPLPAEPFSGCAAVLVPAPERAWPEPTVAALAQFHAAGGAVFLLLPPIIADGLVASSGFEAWLLRLGISLGQALVLETDSRLRLPTGVGETFFAQAEPHPITLGLTRGHGVPERVLVSQSRPLGPLPEGEFHPAPLLQSSPRSLGVDNLALLEASLRGKAKGAQRGPFALGYALQRGKGAPKEQGRLILFGTSSVATNRAFRDPNWLASRWLVESSISWLTERGPLLSVPDRPKRPVGLSLSEASLGELRRYVLLYMPGSAALFALWLLLRRRRSPAPVTHHDRGADA
jgi:hypothetical protein